MVTDLWQTDYNSVPVAVNYLKLVGTYVWKDSKIILQIELFNHKPFKILSPVNNNI